jgi:hypothetical protein
MMANFDPVTGSVVVPDKNALTLVSPAFPKNVPVVTADQVGFPLLLRDRPQFHWFPRFGFAYRPFTDTKTVVRGSYGIFSVPPDWEAGGGACCAQVGGALVTTAPFALDEAFSNSITGGVPSFAFPNPFPNTIGAVPGQIGFGVNKNFPFAYTQNWNFTIEREVIANTAIRATYLGAKGTNLPYQAWISPAIGGEAIYSNFSRVEQVDAGANMTYEGMELSLKRRFSAGMQFEIFYSLGHRMYLQSVVRPWRETDFGDFIEDANNRQRDKGRAPDWADQRVTISHVIELPFGRNKKILGNAPLPLDYVIGGWTLSGFWSFNTWYPMTPVVSGQDPLGLGRLIRAQIVPGCQQNISPTINRIFNTSFSTSPPGEYGTASFDSILVPSWTGLANNYVGIYKDLKLHGFRLAESPMIRIGAKFSNIFNHPYLVAAGNAGLVGSSSFGRGAMVGARQILFELKAQF